MTRMLRAALAIAAVAAAVPPAAAAPGEALYSVRFQMDGIDTRGGQPSLTAREGEPATLMIGNDSYSLRIVTTADARRRVAVRSEVAYWTPRGIVHHGGELSLAADGEAGRFAFPRTDPATGEVREVSVTVSVVPLGD